MIRHAQEARRSAAEPSGRGGTSAGVPSRTGRRAGWRDGRRDGSACSGGREARGARQHGQAAQSTIVGYSLSPSYGHHHVRQRAFPRAAFRLWEKWQAAPGFHQRQGAPAPILVGGHGHSRSAMARWGGGISAGRHPVLPSVPSPVRERM